MRQKQELEEFEDRFRRENQVVTIQASHLSDKPEAAFTLEVKFPLSPSRREIDKVNHAVHDGLVSSLEKIGYKLEWREPKTWE